MQHRGFDAYHLMLLVLILVTQWRVHMLEQQQLRVNEQQRQVVEIVSTMQNTTLSLLDLLNSKIK